LRVKPQRDTQQEGTAPAGYLLARKCLKRNTLKREPFHGAGVAASRAAASLAAASLAAASLAAASSAAASLAAASLAAALGFLPGGCLPGGCLPGGCLPNPFPAKGASVPLVDCEAVLALRAARRGGAHTPPPRAPPPSTSRPSRSWRLTSKGCPHPTPSSSPSLHSASKWGSSELRRSALNGEGGLRRRSSICRPSPAGSALARPRNQAAKRKPFTGRSATCEKQTRGDAKLIAGSGASDKPPL